jgi:hypothetical protein
MLTAINTAHTLYGVLNEANTAEQIRNAVSTVLTVLEHTHGMWAELHYSYKAQEIAKCCRDRLDEVTAMCSHWKTHEACGKLRQKAIKIEQEYYRLQMDYLHGSRTEAVAA